MTDEKTHQLRYLEEAVNRRHRTPVTVLEAALGQRQMRPVNLSLESRIEDNKLKAIERQLETLVGASMLGHRSLAAYAQFQIASNGFASLDPEKDEHVIAPVLSRIEAEKRKYPSPLEAAYVCTLNRVINGSQSAAASGDPDQPVADGRAAQLSNILSSQSERGRRQAEANGEHLPPNEIGRSRRNLQRDIIDEIAANSVSISRWEDIEERSSVGMDQDDPRHPNPWSETVSQTCDRIRHNVMPRARGFPDVTQNSHAMSPADAVKAAKLVRARENIEARKAAANEVADTLGRIIKPTGNNREKSLERLRAVSAFRDYWLEPGEHLHLRNMYVTMHHLSGLKGEEYDKHVKLAQQLRQFDEVWDRTAIKTAPARAASAKPSDRHHHGGNFVPAASPASGTKRSAVSAFNQTAPEEYPPGKRRETTDLRGLQDRPNNRDREPRNL